MIKTTLRLPTDEYSYIEVEVEVENLKGATAAYYELKEAYFKANAMPQIEYNTIYDLVRAKQPIVGDPGMQMSTAQKFALNELKKSNARNVTTKQK